MNTCTFRISSELKLGSIEKDWEVGFGISLISGVKLLKKLNCVSCSTYISSSSKSCVVTIKERALFGNEHVLSVNYLGFSGSDGEIFTFSVEVHLRTPELNLGGDH